MSALHARVRIGVSACLLGELVRYDGGHKRDRRVTGILARRFELVAVCPEVEVGLGVPREPLSLVRAGGVIRMVALGSGTDHSTAMRRYARRRVRELGRMQLCGYVLKARSPSCGPSHVPTYTSSGVQAASDRGLFASALIAADPLLPVVEESSLVDRGTRDRFIERVLGYDRLRSLFDHRWNMHALMEFHARETLRLRSRQPAAAEALARLIAGAADMTRAELGKRYRHAYMNALAGPSTRRSRTPAKHENRTGKVRFDTRRTPVRP